MLAAGFDLWNMYGPTETTVWSSVENVASANNRISIASRSLIRKFT